MQIKMGIFVFQNIGFSKFISVHASLYHT
uniref:Uncharacterized protein n=1 Tax=Rhizophora mucronata TaxID=61149 RepID=A0A2P2PEA7_RHIMU